MLGMYNLCFHLRIAEVVSHSSKNCWHVFYSLSCLVALDPNLKSTLDKVVTSQKIVLFMKGTKEFPQCGFSNTVVQILKALNAPFETLNILENEALRQGLKEYSSWPTFPQLYIDGEFFGGCDIVVGRYTNWYFNMHQNFWIICTPRLFMCTCYLPPTQLQVTLPIKVEVDGKRSSSVFCVCLDSNLGP